MSNLHNEWAKVTACPACQIKGKTQNGRFVKEDLCPRNNPIGLYACPDGHRYQRRILEKKPEADA